MALTGFPFLLVVCLLAVGTAVATAVVWRASTRWGAVTRWGSALAWTARSVCLAGVMLAGGVLALTETNRVYGFYDTFSELLGKPPAAILAADDTPAGLPPRVIARGHLAAARGQGIVFSVVFDGVRSRIRRPAFVYLPARYFTGPAGMRFPVVELFHGYPGIPRNWLSQLNLAGVLDQEIQAGRIPPMIAVVPTDTDGARDEECVNAARGAADDTYLASDVPDAVIRDYRAQTGARAWATMGYSTGGYCAVNLALRHSDRYGAAVSMSGYFTAEGGRLGRAMFHGSGYLAETNSPSWLIRNRPNDLALYLVSSAGDTEAATDLIHFRRNLPPDADVTTVQLPTGGHNYKVWASVVPAAIDWIGSQLAGPTTPPLVTPRAVVTNPGGTTDGPGTGMDVNRVVAAPPTHRRQPIG